MERIATANHQNTLVRYMMQAESRVAAAQISSSSGLKSTDFKGVASDSGRIVDLDSTYRRTERYIDEGEVVAGRIDTMDSTVGSMIDVTNRLQSLITSLQGAASSAAEGVQEEAAGLMKEFVALLNTRLEGRYLFAGSRTDTAPVNSDTSSYPPATVPSTADTSWYGGDGSLSYFQAADDLVIEYGATADDPAIEKAMRAFNLLSTMSTDPVDADVLDEASTLAADGVDGMSVIRARLGTASGTLDRTLDRHVDTQLVLETQVDDLRSVDLAEATVRLSQLQASLEATMSLMKVLQSTNLNDLLA